MKDSDAQYQKNKHSVMFLKMIGAKMSVNKIARVTPFHTPSKH